MGRTYYYFAASLPMIGWNGKLPMATSEFLSSAKRLMQAEDAGLIGHLLSGQESAAEFNNPVARSWAHFDRSFRNEIAWFRAHRLHKDPAAFIRAGKENDPWLRETVHEAGRMEDLLEGEMLLDKTRWQFLDSLSAGHQFDLEYLICYGLKLKILERHQMYRSPKGQEMFTGMQQMELPVDWAASGI